MPGPEVRRRTAVRAILLTPERETLLIRMRPPHGGEDFWVTPGGGVRPGEVTETALRRELAEELGLSGVTIGPVLLRRRHTFTWGGEHIRQSEQLHIVPVNRFDTGMRDPVEGRFVQELRWFGIRELEGLSERLTPKALAAILENYLASGPPEPVPLEVIVE